MHSGRPRLQELDGFRAMAIGLVLANHCVFMPLREAPGMGALVISCISSIGWCGVGLFFVLSGFLIGGMLLDQKSSPNVVRVFLVRRACRIIPLYAVCLIGEVVVEHLYRVYHWPLGWLFSAPMHLWRYMTFTQNLWAGHSEMPNWIFPTWSLAVEVQFYLFILLLVMWTKRQTLINICIVGLFIGPLAQVAATGFDYYVQLPCRLNSLLLGVLIAVLMRTPSARDVVKSWSPTLNTVFVALGGGMVAMMIRPEAFGRLIFSWINAFFGLMLLLVLLNPQGAMAKFFRVRWMVGFGRISYGVFLFHEVFNGLIHGLIRKDAPRILNLNDAAVTGLALVTTVLFATAAHYWIELPAIRLGHRLTFSKAPAPQAPARILPKIVVAEPARH